MASTVQPQYPQKGGAVPQVTEAQKQWDQRQRDPLAQLPFWPPRAGFGLAAKYSLGRKQERILRRSANATIGAIRACWKGDFKDARVSQEEVFQHEWDASTPLQKRLVLSVFEAVIQFGLLPEPPSGEEAFRQVACGTAVEGY